MATISHHVRHVTLVALCLSVPFAPAFAGEGGGGGGGGGDDRWAVFHNQPQPGQQQRIGSDDRAGGHGGAAGARAGGPGMQ